MNYNSFFYSALQTLFVAILLMVFSWATIGSNPVQDKSAQSKPLALEALRDVMDVSIESWSIPETMNIENQNINKAIKQGDAVELASFFNNSLELVLPNNEGTYSKVQAQMILSLFFDKNPPRSFSVKQEGSSPNNTNFVIGTYVTTASKTYRVYYVTKKVGNRDLIQHLEFENI